MFGWNLLHWINKYYIIVTKEIVLIADAVYCQSGGDLMLATYESNPHSRGGVICLFPLEPLMFSTHWHEEIEIMYVREGALEVTIDSQRYIFKQGDLVIVHPNSIHSYHSSQYNRVLFILLFSPDIFGFPLTSTSSIYHCMPTEQEKIDALFTALRYNESQSGGPSALHNISFLAQLLVLCKEHGPDIELTPARDHDVSFNQSILSYLNDNFRSNPTLEETAQKFNFSPSYFSTFFKKQFGLSFKAHLIELKIQAACNELTNTNRPIIDICYDLGYRSLRSFNRNFMDLMGLSPREYRRKNNF